MNEAKNGERLIHFPVNIFAVVMGLTGLTLAVQRLEDTLGTAHGASLPFVIASAAVFLLIGAIYLAKALRYRSAVKAEWNHPVRIAFFPAITISVVLLATALMPFSRPVATILWIVGAMTQLATTVAVISAWIGHRSFETPHINPAWFIPAVGNVIVPIAGVPLGYAEFSWFFFSIGLIFWVVLLTLVFNRLIFHNPLPERLYPTLVILIAPPAVAFSAYMSLTAGPPDAFARILYYSGLFFVLLVAIQLPRFTRLPFSLAWWAYSFPMAAITIAALRYADEIGSQFHLFLGYALFTVLVVVIAILLARTASAIRKKQICRPE